MLASFGHSSHCPYLLTMTTMKTKTYRHVLHRRMKVIIIHIWQKFLLFFTFCLRFLDYTSENEMLDKERTKRLVVSCDKRTLNVNTKKALATMCRARLYNKLLPTHVSSKYYAPLAPIMEHYMLHVKTERGSNPDYLSVMFCKEIHVY